MDKEYQMFDDFKAASLCAKELTLKYKEKPSVVSQGRGFAVLASETLLAKIDSSKKKQETAKSNIKKPLIRTKKIRSTPAKNTSKLIVSRNRSIAGISPSIGRITTARFKSMTQEIRTAYKAAPSSVRTQWVNYTLSLLASAFVRRVGNVVDLCIVILEKTGREIIDFSFALIEGKAGGHLSRRSKSVSLTTTKKLNEWTKLFKKLVSSFQENPGEIGPDILVASLAFAFASGGLDGDGGVPDSDITMFGIDAHRSLFTHSILSGAVIEAGLYSMVDFVSRAYNYLPKKHDPIWDTIHNKSAEAAESAAKGVSVGLAYHFGVDALLQPAAFHDLPFPAPIEAHQAIMGANALGEGLDTSKKARAKKSNAPKAKSKRDVAGIAVSAGLGVLFWMLG
jgi:hypothetical protein